MITMIWYQHVHRCLQVLLNRIRYIGSGESVDHRYIMKYGPQHFSGANWCGSDHAIMTFISEFRRITEMLLDEGLAHTDEQVTESIKRNLNSIKSILQCLVYLFSWFFFEYMF